jgi:hypothetical protein
MGTPKARSVSGTIQFRRRNSQKTSGAKPSLYHGVPAHESFLTTPFEKEPRHAGPPCMCRKRRHKHSAREPNDPNATDAPHASSGSNRTASGGLGVSSCGQKSVPTGQPHPLRASPPLTFRPLLREGAPRRRRVRPDVVNAAARARHFPLWLTARRGLTGKWPGER